MFLKGRVPLLLLARSVRAQPATSELRTRTVTITTTGTTTKTTLSSIDSTPTMLAEQDAYTFQGCFEQSDSDDAGKALGYDFIIPANASVFDKLTASLCAELCGSARTTSGGEYAFSGVSNGRDCYCGTTISPNTHQDLDDKCPIPCPGDPTQSCGGNGYIAIYSLDSSHTTQHAANSPNRQASSTTPSGEAPTFYAAENAQDDQPSKAPTGPTVAVIASSVSGFVLLCALIFIGVKLHRRNRQLQAAGHRRTESQPGILVEAKERGKSVTFKKRHSIITDGVFSPKKRGEGEQNGPRPLILSGDVGGAEGRRDGATTGVEWRLNNNNVMGNGLSPRTPSARESNSMTLPIHQKPETAAQVPGLGDRAWHRRRYSVPFPPKAAKGAVGKEKLTLAQAGPSSQPEAEHYVQGDVPTLPVLDFDPPAKTGSGIAPQDSSEPSPPFTLWTLPSTPSLPHFDRMGENTDKKGVER